MLAKNGFIFSPKIDTLYSWGVLLLLLTAFLLTDLNFYSEYESLKYVLLIGIPIEMAHVCSTFIPLMARMKKNQLNLNKVLLISTLTIILLVFFYSVTFELFITCLAFFAIFHIFRQHYGFFMVSRAKTNDQSSRIIDNIFSINIMLFPLLWWISDHKPFAQSYFHRDDFITGIPIEIANILHTCHLLIILFYIFYQFYLKYKNVSLNLFKLSNMFSVWTWLYLSIVILKNPDIFWSFLIINHGLFYITYSHLDYGYQKNPSMKKIYFNYSFFAISILLAIIWYVSNNMVIKPNFDLKHWSMAFVWVPLIVHYVFDFFIWKKRYSPFNSSLAK
jgi:hypothetical protein